MARDHNYNKIIICEIFTGRDFLRNFILLINNHIENMILFQFDYLDPWDMFILDFPLQHGFILKTFECIRQKFMKDHAQQMEADCSAGLKIQHP